MENISNITFSPLKDSIYMEPLRIYYEQNGIKKSWDLMSVHNSVIIILFNITRRKLIFVKQFRPAVYYSRIPEEDRKTTIDTSKYKPELGVTLELCAGIIDKNKSVEEIAKEEVLEECGYDIPLSDLQKIISICVNPGVLGCQQTFFYGEVTDEMKKSEGGGVGDELIEVVELSVSDVKKYINSEIVNSPPGLLFGIHWFLQNKPEFNC